MGFKNTLKTKVWGSTKYFIRNEKEYSADSFNDVGITKLKEYINKSFNILDFGCGNGMAIKMFYEMGKRWTGIDISQNSINQAKKILEDKQDVILRCGDLEKFDVARKYDCVYSLYVFEHLDNPELVLDNMMRVVTPGGVIAILCPNYGSPTEHSPAYISGLARRAMRNFFKSCFGWLFGSGLGWEKVVPPITLGGEYFSDSDVVNEPYLGSLIRYVTRQGFEIVEWDSGLSDQQIVAGNTLFGILKKIFLKLGKLKIWPFCYWGPKVFLIAKCTK